MVSRKRFTQETCGWLSVHLHSNSSCWLRWLPSKLFYFEEKKTMIKVTKNLILYCSKIVCVRVVTDFNRTNKRKQFFGAITYSIAIFRKYENGVFFKAKIACPLCRCLDFCLEFSGNIFAKRKSSWNRAKNKSRKSDDKLSIFYIFGRRVEEMLPLYFSKLFIKMELKLQK